MTAATGPHPDKMVRGTNNNAMPKRFSFAAFLCVSVFGGLTLSAAKPARADVLDQIQKQGELRWGGDENGGGPYVFPDEKDPNTIRGFEVELADMLAKSLGGKATFIQGDWEKVPELIDSGRIDIAMNGYELTPDRQRRYLCSVPYYVYGFQLLVRANSPYHSWADLEGDKKRRPKIGALVGSAALAYLRTIPNIQAISYDGTTDSMNQVVGGVDDGTLQDDPTAIYYADQFPELRRVGRPVSEGYYVVLMGKQETKLKQAIDNALEQFIHDGQLKSLYDHWNLSGKAQMLALGDLRGVAAPTAYPSFADILRNNWRILLEAAGMTVILSVLSMPLAVLIGISVACGRMYGPWLVAKPLGLYVELLRGTPLMLQLYAIFFLLPKIGVALPALAAAIAGLAINYSAYEAEIYRAGLQAVPRGQMEAALSLGMSRPLAIWRIILPQAFRIVIPPVTNDFIALFKDTSVCSVVTVVELTKEYDILAMSTGAIVQLAIVTATLYMLMSYPLSVFARWSERRLANA
ncbi:MAG TPA: ABC transporter substrate-binding protein/permease [Pirellulales bacterium]|nr:ABC transporter substrate-binding protein/permease [Pirellulales bacterium]